LNSENSENKSVVMHLEFMCNWINSLMFVELNILTAQFFAWLCAKTGKKHSPDHAVNLGIFQANFHAYRMKHKCGKFLMVSCFFTLINISARLLDFFKFKFALIRLSY
jgi:hypothetical protein